KMARYQKCVDYLQRYLKETAPSGDERRRVEEYLATASEEIGREEKRIERDKERAARDAQEKAQQEVAPAPVAAPAATPAN
ncbi:MAG: hypothetical protein AAB426_04485, partial [Myxococcota bacterium]